MARTSSLGVFAVGALVAGCIALPLRPVNPSILNGPAVAQTIDAVIDGQLKSYDPTLSISPSQCPDQLDIGSTTTPTCSITVNGVPLRVFVTPNGPPPGYYVRLRGGVFERRFVERLLAAEAEQSIGGHLTASCPMASVIVAPDNTTFVCRLSGAQQPASMVVRVDSNGKLRATLNSKSKRQVSPLDLRLQRVVELHVRGERAIIDGRTVAQSIDERLAKEWAIMRGGRSLWGAVRCPPLVDVSGSAHAHCRAPFDGQIVHFDFWVEGKNVRYQRTDAILDMELLQRSSQQMIGQELATGGFSQRALVSCKGRYAVVPVPSDIYCDVLIGTEPARIRIHVLDILGHTNINVVFNSPSP